MRDIFLIFLLVWTTSCLNKYDEVSDPPVGQESEEPAIVATANGLVLSWLEPLDGDIHLKMAVYNDSQWSESKTIAKGDDWFVNWADFPAIVANGNTLFAHFLKKSSIGTYDYDIMFTHSTDFGSTWSKPRKLYSDTTEAEHGFVSAIPYKDGFYVTWLDGRNTKKDGGAMTLRGAYVTAEGEVIEEQEIDSSTCDCCQTALVKVNGEPFSVYRDRSEGEIRDIYYTRLDTNTWQQSVPLNADEWEIKGCPVNGPAVASFGQTVAAAWFTGVGGKSSAYLKISNNGGNDFDAKIPVSINKTLGRVDVKMNSEHIYVTHLSHSDNDTFIELLDYSHEGKLLEKARIASVESDRGTGFPALALWKNSAIITWTDIKTGRVKVFNYSLDKALN